MAFSIIAALAAAATAATGVAGTVIGSQNAQNTNNTQTAIGKNATQNSLNQQQYQQALNALALKRSIAGTQDGRGSTNVYDPATNTWRTTLSPQGAAVQGASDQASIKRNTVDLNTAQDANNNSMLAAIKARNAAGPALSAVENFKPMSSQGLEGALQETATSANRAAQDPIIADTLRQFARTGTAAGPVLTGMMRDNANTLRTTMLQDKIAAMKNVGDINNGRRAGLVGTYQALDSAAHPQLSFPGISTNNPIDALSAEMNSRAGGASQPATTGAYSSSSGTGQFNNASALYAKEAGGSNLGASILGAGTQISSLFDPKGPFAKLFAGGSGNTGDLPSTPNAFGNASSDASNKETYG